jgi:hypothetical protein
MQDALARLLSVVKVCRSPEYTAPGCVSTGDALDNAGVRARHCLRGRDPVHPVSDAQEGTEDHSYFVLSDNFANRSPLHPKISRE